jgi:hypothetical protein
MDGVRQSGQIGISFSSRFLKIQNYYQNESYQILAPKLKLFNREYFSTPNTNP